MKFYGGIQVLGDKSVITIDSWPDKDNPYSGWIAWENVESSVQYNGQALYYDINSKIWKLACANNKNTMPCTAICLGVTNGNGEMAILRFGNMYTSRYTWRSLSLYVDPFTPGKITDVQPTSVGHLVQIIGNAKSNNVGFFDFCPIFVEVG